MEPQRWFLLGRSALVADVASKANSADVYNKAQVDAEFVPQGLIVMRHGTSELTPNNTAGATVQNFGTGSRMAGDGFVNFTPSGPATLGGVEYGLKSIEYCISQVAGAQIDQVAVYGEQPLTSFFDDTDRTANGCYKVTANQKGSNAYDIQIGLKNAGTLRFSGIRTTWAPASQIAESPVSDGAAIDPGATGGRRSHGRDERATCASQTLDL